MKDVVHQERPGSVAFDCPGCEMAHVISVDGHRNEATNASWGWNGSFDKPTFTPSILVKWNEKGQNKCCHSFVREGQIEFLSDCTHMLAGTKVQLQPWSGEW